MVKALLPQGRLCWIRSRDSRFTRGTVGAACAHQRREGVLFDDEPRSGLACRRDAA